MLTASSDKNGRVSLATILPGASFAWFKNDVPFATTGSGSVIDNRPQKNYKRAVYSPGGNTDTVSFSFSGVEFGLYVTPVAGLALTITIDGVPYYYTIDAGSNRFSGSNQLIWGKSGLANGNHNISVVRTGGGSSYLSQLFKSYVYSDFSISFRQPITYKVIVDGTAQETATITPMVDRVAATQSLLDRVIAGGSLTTFPSHVPYPSYYDTTEFMGSIAGAYFILGDSRLPAIAASIYSEHMTRTDANGVFLTEYLDQGNYNTAPWEIVTNGRTALNYWFAYKVFGNASYLAVADKITDTFLNLWWKNGSSVLGWLYGNLTLDGNGGPYTNYTGAGAPGNQYACAAYGMALLYNEPASSHYQSPALYTLMMANINEALAMAPIDGTTGAIAYGSTPGDIKDNLYGFMTWQCYKYFADHFNWHVSDVAKATAWFNSLPLSEPYFYRSEFYWGCPPSIAFIRAQTEVAQHGSVSADFIDLFFSAAFDNVGDGLNNNDGTNPDYDPEGFSSSSTGIVNIQTSIASVFWTVQMLVAMDGLPNDVDAWYASFSIDGLTIIPVIDNITLIAASVRGRTASGSSAVVRKANGDEALIYDLSGSRWN